MATYLYQLSKWPNFTWNQERIAVGLKDIYHKQGQLLEKMDTIGSKLRSEANLQMLTLNVLKSSEIEGEILNRDQVRSTITRILKLDTAETAPTDQQVEGIVELILDATQHYADPLTHERLFAWHSAMFPTDRRGIHKIVVGRYRDNTPDNPMQVVSGPIGREKVHYQAPDSEVILEEMTRFLNWFNRNNELDPVLKSAIAHFWFIAIHPFDDGNGRIARAIADMQLCRADQRAERFYSMSAQIRIERKGYYDILEKTQQGSLDITDWLEWFLDCLDRAIVNSEQILTKVIAKARFWEKHAATPLNDRQRLMLNKMLDGFEGKVTNAKWAKITKTNNDTAGSDIKDLLEKEILVKDRKIDENVDYNLKTHENQHSPTSS